MERRICDGENKRAANLRMTSSESVLIFRSWEGVCFARYCVHIRYYSTIHDLDKHILEIQSCQLNVNRIIAFLTIARHGQCML